LVDFQETSSQEPRLVLNYIKDCQSILVEVVSADRTKNNNKMAKLSIKFTIPTFLDDLIKTCS
jgi:hypothetical protein